MAYTFSTDQQSIIDARNQNILVSAAAGSGKTSVLTERIVRLVNDPLDPVDVDRILVVTFTNAAAAEMKERIAKRLSDLLDSEPENEHLQKQSQLIHNAQITTIDSFCLHLVKNYFHKIGVDPAFRVAGEGEMKLLKQDVMKDCINAAYESKDPDFYHIVDCYSKKDNDDSLEESIMKIYNFAMSHPFPEKWLNAHRNDYAFRDEAEFAHSELVSQARADIKEYLEDILALTDRAIEICSEPQGPAKYADAIEADKMAVLDLMGIAEKGEYDEIAAALSTKIWTDFPRTKSAECDPILKENVQDIHKQYKELLPKCKSRILSDSLSDAFEAMQKAGRVVNKLIDLVLSFYNAFGEAKRDRGVIDFPDMEHMAVQILISEYEDAGHYTISQVAENLRDHYAEVMVDEYQDSNEVQEIIIQSVSRELSDKGNNRFMVGDVKQSIYRFRLARPEIFVGKTENYIKDPAAVNRLITLRENYRSRDAVIDSVNAIFERVMLPVKGNHVVYDDDARLRRGGEFTPDTEANRTELLLLQTGSLKKEDYMPMELSLVAERIKDAVENMQVYDRSTKSLRKAGYGDIAVLFRSPGKLKDEISEAFENARIPFHLEGTGNLYDTREIQDVLSFLTVVDNPLNDIALYAAMTSFFGGFTDSECAIIKASDSENAYYFWDRLTKYAEDPEHEKAAGFTGLVSKYRKYVTYMPIHEVLTTLFEETGYRHVVAALPDGGQRLANVNMLVSKAQEYGRTSFYGLFHFLRYVELLKKIEQEEGEANIFDESSDTVRIMSIHKSKGLEFPICIVAAVDEAFNKRDLTQNFVADIDEGIGARCIDPERRTQKNTLKRNLIVNRLDREGTAEEMRILYVALTRAREKLIMAGTVKDAEKWLNSVAGVSYGSYLDMIKEAVSDSKTGDLFDVRIIENTEGEVLEIEEEADRQGLRNSLEAGLHINRKIYDGLRTRLDFTYPYSGLADLYTKTTVSELKLQEIEKHTQEDGSYHPFEENESHEYIPKFAGGGEEVKGTDRGTAYHNVLQLLDFSAFIDDSGKVPEAELRKAYENRLRSIVAKGKMSEADVSKVFEGKIIKFLESSLATRMGRAEKNGSLFKEQPFVMGVPASEVNEGFPSSETVLIQGVIDAYFIEDGQVVLMDYKTDRVESGQELKERYHKQLDYYAMAISQLTGLKVKEKILYSFALSEEIPV